MRRITVTRVCGPDVFALLDPDGAPVEEGEIVTLLGALKKTGGKRGVASLCIGGGEATAMAVELA